jgi:hypothetical protein
MKQMRKSTDPDTQLDLIELEQDASFRQPARDTALGADLIRLWFRPAEAAAGTSQEFRLMDQNAAAEPKRLLALKQVAFVSPQVEYEGQHQVVFDDEPSPSARPDAPVSGRVRPSAGALTSQRKSVDHGLKKALAAGFASVPPEQNSPTDRDQESASKPPMEVSAEKMRVRLLPVTTPDQPPEVAEIWTAGQVKVIQPSENGGLPVVVTGDRLHVQNNSATDQLVHVFGEPGRPRISATNSSSCIEGDGHLDRGPIWRGWKAPGLLRCRSPRRWMGSRSPAAGARRPVEARWTSTACWRRLKATCGGSWNRARCSADDAGGTVSKGFLQRRCRRRSRGSVDLPGWRGIRITAIRTTNCWRFKGQGL